MDLGFVRIFKIMLLQARMPVTEYVILSRIAKECKTCMAQGRTAQASGKIMVMQELSVNSVLKEDEEKVRRSRPPRTRYGCSVCQIHLCQGGPCWEEHILLTIKA
jgi:hypothetical protein